MTTTFQTTHVLPRYKPPHHPSLSSLITNPLFSHPYLTSCPSNTSTMPSLNPDRPAIHSPTSTNHSLFQNSSNHSIHSVPAACASLLSLRTSVPPTTYPSTLPPPPDPCVLPPLSVSPLSVSHLTNHVISTSSTSRKNRRCFWETVMEGTACVQEAVVSENASSGGAPPGALSERSVESASRAADWPHAAASTPHDEACKMNIPCVVCGVRFRKPGHLNMHWRSVHAASPDAKYPPKVIPVKDGRVGKGNRVMAPVPERSNANPLGAGRAYGCPQCDARFRRGSDRNRHMRMVHAKIRPYKCKQCGNHFGRKSFLEAHVLTVHEKLRPFRCECGAAFGQRSSLTRHTRKIHGKEP